MKISLTFSLILFSMATIWGQNAQDSIPTQVDKEAPKTECSQARLDAAADFKKGIRKIYLFGLVDDYKYRKLLSDKYNIEVRSMGCLVLPEYKCYSDCMEELITQERGFGFFEKVRVETGSKGMPIKSVMKSTF